MRALSDVENIGSKNSEGSKIYLNAQTWAVLGDVADAEKLPKILKAVDSMEHDFGFPLNLPPYQKYSPNVGECPACCQDCLKMVVYTVMLQGLKF